MPSLSAIIPWLALVVSQQQLVASLSGTFPIPSPIPSSSLSSLYPKCANSRTVCFGFPENCVPSSACTFLFHSTYEPTNGGLSLGLMAPSIQADQYIAVAFSNQSSMSGLVSACVATSKPKLEYSFNVYDDHDNQGINQSDVNGFTELVTSYTDGTLSCEWKVEKESTVSYLNYRYEFSRSSYYVLLAMGPYNVKEGHITFHHDNYLLSQSPVNLKGNQSPPLPSIRATLTGNLTQPKVGVPFTITCSISVSSEGHLSPDTDYSVAFYSASQRLLAAYEQTNGESMLTIAKHAGLEIHPGTVNTGWPVFSLNLNLIEQISGKQEYWCSVGLPNEAAIESTHWPNRPSVAFTSSKGHTPTVRLGTCTLGNFQEANGTFSIQFWTDLGPKSVNRLATYLITPNEMFEFDIEEVAGWTAISHTSTHAYPAYSIQASRGTFNGTWWCILGVGEAGSPNYQEFKSETVDLS